MASKPKGRAGSSRASKTPTTAAGGGGGSSSTQLTLYTFMDLKPKATQTPPQPSPAVPIPPSVKTDAVYSTNGRGINAGEKRKKAEVIDLTSDEEDPPLKRRKPSVVSSSSTCSFQVSKTGKYSVAKHLATGSRGKWTSQNLAANTPCSGPKPYSRDPGVFHSQSPLLREERGRSGGSSENSSLSAGPPILLPEGGHGIDSLGIDMESDVVPCSQTQDDLPFAFPPIAPFARTPPLQTIISSLQPSSSFLPTFTPKSVRTSQQEVSSSATPSDFRQSHGVHIERIGAPPIPVFTPYSQNDLEWQPPTDDPLPPSSFPGSTESSRSSIDFAEDDDEQEPFPTLPHLNEQDDRIESSQLEESFEFAFHIPPLPPPTRKPLRRRTPRVSVDGAVTRNPWSNVFDALSATQKSDPTAAQSPRKRAASSPMKPVTETLLWSDGKSQKSEEEGGEGIFYEQSSFHPVRTPSLTKSSWPGHTPQRQPSPLRILLSQTRNQISPSPMKRPALPSPSKTAAFPSPSKSAGFPSPSKPSTLTSPSGHALSNSGGAPFVTPKRPRSPTATGPEGSPSAAFGIAYVSPPMLPNPGGSSPVSRNREDVGISQYPESLADEPLPDFLLTFGESQGMEDWIKEMQMQG